MSLNPFLVRHLQPEVELLALIGYCTCADITVMFETGGIGQTPSLLERAGLLCNVINITRVI